MDSYTPAEQAFIDTPTSDYDRMYPDLTRNNRERVLRWSRTFRQQMESGTWVPSYSYWRHGGSYVGNIVYPSGAVGCIASARHTYSKKFEIACPPAGHDATYATRDAAARAEAEIALAQWESVIASYEVVASSSAHCKHCLMDGTKTSGCAAGDTHESPCRFGCP